jgi:pseudouridine-5'-phosphate glycosidase
LIPDLFIPSPLQLAIKEGRPVVALESTVIASGLPTPYNLQAAEQCQTAIAQMGAVAATIAVIAGQVKIGCSNEELHQLAALPDVIKTNLSNLSAVVAEKRWGATTVSATLHLAAQAQIPVFATGGIGGVHRNAERSFDISTDLMALARYPVIVVCAGAKSVLDLARTVEILETMAVPIVGYQTDELPSFYARRSGIKLAITADTPRAIASLALTHWRLGLSSALLVVVPVPAADEIPLAEVSSLCKMAITEAEREQISGKAVTPYLLATLDRLSNGRTVKTNLALLANNARTAAEIAMALTQQQAMDT